MAWKSNTACRSLPSGRDEGRCAVVNWLSLSSLPGCLHPQADKVKELLRRMGETLALRDLVFVTLSCLFCSAVFSAILSSDSQARADVSPEGHQRRAQGHRHSHNVS